MGTGIPAGAGRRTLRWGGLAGAVLLAAAAASAPATAAPAHGGPARTATPIKHLVVLFDENISFDHYFATYPHAANTDGTHFTASRHTPRDIATLAGAGLLEKNPNLYLPMRLSPSQAVTCDQNHNYAAEQYAYNGGKADQFVQSTEVSKCSGGLFGEPGLSMDYYDGNTVTALWNYAQHYAMSDNSFGSVYGPSTPGALELASGQTHGVISTDPASSTEHPVQTTTPDPYAVVSPDAHGVGTMINDPDPAFDDCSGTDHTSKSALAEMTGRNIGDLLNSKGVSWGWFQGGFTPSTPWNGQQDDRAKCAGTTHANIGGAASEDYSPHHNPFAYYETTANPHHLSPASLDEVGHDGRANHGYDLSWFNRAASAGRLPAVSFLKAPSYQDGHAGYSDPIDEQHFLVDEINAVQKSPQWANTAVVIAYDDSDGWYDHVYAKPTNGSQDTTVGSSGKTTDSPGCQSGPAPVGGYQDRCGPGTRQPMVVISPYTRADSVDHTPLEQTSIIRFVEDNWHTGRIGDHSFDQRAASLDALLDFRHPDGKQVLLRADGSVASVRPVRHPRADVEAVPVRTDNAAAQMSVDGSGFPALPVSLGLGALVVVGAGVAFTLRRRHTAGS